MNSPHLEQLPPRSEGVETLNSGSRRVFEIMCVIAIALEIVHIGTNDPKEKGIDTVTVRDKPIHTFFPETRSSRVPIIISFDTRSAVIKAMNEEEEEESPPPKISTIEKHLY